jgi:hypothetical protein
MEFAQINPDLEPMFLYPGIAGSYLTVLYTFPVEPKSVFKLVKWQRRVLNGIVIHYSSFSSSFYIETKKPGLYYYGSYIWDFENEEFINNPDKTELDALNAMAKNFKDTVWENVIAARIEELSK